MDANVGAIVGAVMGGIQALINAIVAVTLFAAAGIGLIFYPVQRLVSRKLDASAQDFSRRLGATVHDASTLHRELPPSVFLKPIGDEAALALVWTSAMAAVGQRASSLLFYSLQWLRDRWMSMPPGLRILVALLLTAAWSMGTALLIVTVGGGDSLSSAFRTASYFEGPLAWMFFVALICGLAAWAAMLLMVVALFAVLLVALLAALGIGMPSLYAALYFRFSVEATPTGSHQLVLVDVSPNPSPDARIAPGRLSHSALYGNPGAIRAVLMALEKFEAGRSS